MLKYLTKVANRSGLDSHIRNNVYYGKNLGSLAGALGVGALGGMGGAYTSAAKDILQNLLRGYMLMLTALLGVLLVILNYQVFKVNKYTTNKKVFAVPLNVLPSHNTKSKYGVS
jgi:amino acid permease